MVTVVRGSDHSSNCRPQGDSGLVTAIGLIIVIEIQAMQLPSLDIFSWVLGAGAFLLALWVLYRIGGWFLGRVVRDVQEQIEGE